MSEQLFKINEEQGLYVIDCGGGYTCLGFDVCLDRTQKLAAELRQRGVAFQSYLTTAARGTRDAYNFYNILLELARQYHELTGYRFTYELHPQLVGLEGKRVEVVQFDEDVAHPRRFFIGKSTGWVPCHLEIATRRSSGGEAVCSVPFKSIRVVGFR